MARPRRENAEYFPHVVHMRNDDKIKALRRRFKLNGYAIYNMLIEYIAGKEHFQFEYNELALELIAGDFDADTKDIQDVISYGLTLDLFQLEDGFIRCSTLEKKLEPLLSKRKRERERVSAAESPQSKVKKSKVKESYISHGEGKLFVSIKPVYVHDKVQRIYEMDKYFIAKDQFQNIIEAKLTKFKEFIESNPGRVFNDEDHLYSSFKKFCIENPNAKARSPDNPFSEAEINRSLWTDAAWKTRYARDIQTNPEFKKHFQL
jgi:hypothetical protein